MSNPTSSSTTSPAQSTPPSSMSPTASPSSPASPSMPNAATVPATLAELLDERSGMKRKRSTPNFDGIPVSAILEQREKATVGPQREVCSPRRRSLEAAAKAQAAKEAEEGQSMEVDEGEEVMEADDEESDDEDDITVIV